MPKSDSFRPKFISAPSPVLEIISATYEAVCAVSRLEEGESPGESSACVSKRLLNQVCQCCPACRLAQTTVKLSKYGPMFHSSCVISKSELPLIEEELTRYNSQYTALAKQAQLLYSSLVDINRQLLVTGRTITGLKGLTSAVRRLPSEILAMIFTMCLPNPRQFDDQLTPFARNTAPTNVSQVCSRWREVALSTPALWTVFRPSSFAVVQHRGALSKRSKALLQLNLQRSKEYPLQLVVSKPAGLVTYPLRDHSRFKSEQDDLLQFLLQHAHRWSQVTIPFHMQSAETEMRPTFSNLKYLRCYVFTNNLGLFEHSPKLQDVELVLSPAYEPGGRLPRVQLPWAQLHRLILTVDVGEAPALFSVFHMAAANLTFLRICFEGSNIFGITGLGAADDVTMPLLRDLSLTGGRLFRRHLTVAEFLPKMICPALTRLSLTLTDVAQPVIHFITRSGCSVNYFTVEGGINRTLTKILRVLPHLFALSLWGKPDSDFIAHERVNNPSALSALFSTLVPRRIPPEEVIGLEDVGLPRWGVCCPSLYRLRIDPWILKPEHGREFTTLVSFVEARFQKAPNQFIPGSEFAGRACDGMRSMSQVGIRKPAYATMDGMKYSTDECWDFVGVESSTGNISLAVINPITKMLFWPKKKGSQEES